MISSGVAAPFAREQQLSLQFNQSEMMVFFSQMFDHRGSLPCNQQSNAYSRQLEHVIVAIALSCRDQSFRALSLLQF